VQLNFAILEILANRPDGRASIDELWREWEEAAESQDTANRFSKYSEYEGIDLIQGGLIVAEGNSVYITDVGRSVLQHALESLGHIEAGRSDHSRSVKAIDDLIGPELRMKIFDLGLRAPGEALDLTPLEEEQPIEQKVSQTETDADYDDAEAAAHAADETVEVENPSRYFEIDATDIDLPSTPSAPSFLKRDFPSRIQTPFRSARRGLKLPAALSSQLGRFSHILRGHLREGSSRTKIHRRPVGISGALLAALSLVIILVGAGLVIGVTQIKNLKSEITALERQLVLKKQSASADQQEKKNSAEQRNQLQNQPVVPSAETGKNPVDNRAAPAALALSPDEMRLIREYIKPAPYSGPAGAPINVGDPVTIATIPLPSPLTDKVPKLLGGRFTVRNGAIIILKRDSHQADAVLAPN
jgi:hypothetical protein